MVNQCNVTVREEVCLKQNDGWQLCLQWCRYVYEDKSTQEGYRFIWRWPDNKLQAARGQARIPSLKCAEDLIKMASDAGWGDKIGESSF